MRRKKSVSKLGMFAHRKQGIHDLQLTLASVSSKVHTWRSGYTDASGIVLPAVAVGELAAVS